MFLNSLALWLKMEGYTQTPIFIIVWYKTPNEVLHIDDNQIKK